MNEVLLTDALLREFLLGKLPDDERERIESLFLTDAQAREGVLTAEQDLIDDYLEASLSKQDKERFIALYAQTEEQRQKLRITKSIKDWALGESRVSQALPASSVQPVELLKSRNTLSVWRRLSDRFGIKPVFIIPIAATIVIAIVLAVVWLNSRVEQSAHLAIEQELVQLNSPASLHQSPPQMTSLNLRPVTVRSVEPQPEFQPRAETRIVELRLPWIQKERYSTYQAEVRRVGDDESFTIRNLQADDNVGYAIRFRLPAHMLRRGNYQIRLIGISLDGTPSSTEEYTFAVGS